MQWSGASDPFAVASRRIVVVGGTAGIGLAVAVHLAGVGADVTITGRRAAADIATAAGVGFVRMDVIDDGSAVVSTAGLLALLGQRFSPVAWASGVVLVGLGIDYSLHIAFEFASARRRQVVPPAAIRDAIDRTRTPIAFSAVTTMGSVAALYISGVGVLHQLATVFLVGMAFVVLYSRTLLPTLLGTTVADRGLRHVRDRSVHPRPFLGLVGGIIVAAGVAGCFLKWEGPSDLEVLRNEQSLIRLHRLSVSMGASLASTPIVSRGRSLDEAAAVERQTLTDLAPWAPSLGIAFIDAYSQWSVDPDAWAYLQTRLDGDALLNPDRLQASTSTAPGTLVVSLHRGLRELRHRPRPAVAPDRFIRDADGGVELVGRIHVTPKPWGTPPFAGFTARARRLGVPEAVVARIDPERHTARRSRLPWALGASLLWVGGLLLVQFRDLRLSALCLLPVIVGFAVAVVLSALLSIPVSPLTLPGWCLIAGVGVDDSIHVLHRLRNRTPLAACAPAMVLTTLTTIFALVGFAGTSLPGLYDFAIVAAAGLAGALLAALGPVPWLFEALTLSSDPNL